MRSEHATLVGRNHIFDVNIRIFAAMLLQNLECVLDQFTDSGIMPLSIVDLITNVY